MGHIYIDPKSPFTFIFTGIATIGLFILSILAFSSGDGVGIGFGVFCLLFVIAGIGSTITYYEAYMSSKNK